MRLTPELVSKVKRSVRGKEYSKMTEQEWEVLFLDNDNNISTVCAHNGIINDSDPIDPKAGPKTGSKSMPKFAKPTPVQIKPKPVKADKPKADPK